MAKKYRDIQAVRYAVANDMKKRKSISDIIEYKFIVFAGSVIFMSLVVITYFYNKIEDIIRIENEE